MRVKVGLISRAVIRPLLRALVTVWLAVTIAFWAVAALPGDAVSARFGPLSRISAERQAEIFVEMGLDRPLPIQYLNYLGNLITGDLGFSLQRNQAVTAMLAQQFQYTLEIAALGLLFAVLLTLLGQIFKRGLTPWGASSRVSGLLDFAHTLAASTPSYWLGFLLLSLFAFSLKWLPSGGVASPGSSILPALTLAIPAAGYLGQVLDHELDRIELLPFALSSRARGMSRLRFTLTHGLKHSVSAVLGLLVNLIGGVLGGAVLVETVFARPGLGSLTLDAIVMRDMPVVLGVVALAATLFSALTLLTQVTVRLLDPRLRGAVHG
ncbi:ABC transporter permease [Canibacter zhoujuaniae]|uniref:ABC transporter permease n=1 Tax=Canibacter zhoujuaniae TaxID=2708343 RepID=UPI00141DB697|nr:ABC transporter permease [Canibacter zhoujuaniae]